MSKVLRKNCGSQQRPHGRPPKLTATTSPIALELLRLVRESGLTEAEVCKAAKIGKNQITRLRSGEVTVPASRVLGRLLLVLVRSPDLRREIAARAVAARQARPSHRPRFPVPPALQADWNTLKAHNYTNAEAARVLGIPHGASA